MTKFTNLLLTIVAVLIALVFSSAAFGQSSAYSGARTPGTPGDPNCVGGETVLLIQDVVPWGAAPGQDAGGADTTELIAQGKNWCMITSSLIDTTTLSGFQAIVIASAQTSNFYSNLFPGGTIDSNISTWVSNGGVLSAHLADGAAGPGAGGAWGTATFVGGVQHTFYLSNDDDIADASDPLIADGLACPSGNCGVIVDTGTYTDLDGWGYSSHGYFTNLPAGATVVLTEHATGNPVTVEYSYGSGRVIATLTTIEWRYTGGAIYPNAGDLPQNKKLLANDFADITYAQQVQTTPVITDGTTPTIIVFDSTAGQHVEHDLLFPAAGDMTFPLGPGDTSLQLTVTNEIISNSTGWPPYTHGGPFATSLLFVHDGDNAIAGDADGLHDYGSMYEDECFDASHPTPLESSCPYPNSGFYIISKDIFDLSNKPPIALGTTAAFIHYYPNTIPAVTMWSPTPVTATPNPVCTSVTGTPPTCDTRDILVDIYGDGTISGSDGKKGTFAGVYNVPMPLSAVSVNGTSVNTPGLQTSQSSNLWFKSPLSLNFVVNPACPPLPVPCTPPSSTNNYFTQAPVFGEAYDVTYLTGVSVVGTTQAQPPPSTASVSQVTFPGADNMVSLLDGQYLLQYGAVDNVGIKEQNVQLFPLGSTNTCPNPDNVVPAPMPPCYSTSLFQAQINVDSTAPLAPSITLIPPGGYYAQGSTLNATIMCTDPLSNGVASGIATCGPNSGYGGLNPVTVTGVSLPTSTLGLNTYTAAAVDAAGNSSSTTITYYVVGPDDLAIGMFGNLLVKSGTNMTYHIFVVNGGPYAGNLVNVTDTIPAGTSFKSSGYAIDSCTFTKGQPPQCSISPPTNSCGSVPGSCSIGTLPVWANKNPVGAIVQITVEVSAKPGTIITNKAAVSGVNSNSDVKYTTAQWSTLVTK